MDGDSWEAIDLREQVQPADTTILPSKPGFSFGADREDRETLLKKNKEIGKGIGIVGRVRKWLGKVNNRVLGRIEKVMEVRDVERYLLKK
jgi:hypothetical protein